MSAYREAFWVFVGTTGPIIALANVLTFGDATDAVARLRGRDRKPTPVNGENRVRAEFWRRLRIGHIYFVGLSFALSLTLTLLAAFSLWQRTDIIAGPWVIVLLIVTFTLLFILAACSAAFRRDLEALRKSQEGEHGGQGKHHDGLTGPPPSGTITSRSVARTDP